MLNDLPNNPVERRLFSMQDDWFVFANQPDAKLLYWQVSEDDIPLLETYLQIQAEKANSVISFYQDFISPEQYEKALSQQLIDDYESHKSATDSSEIVADWIPPEKSSSDDFLVYFIKLAESLLSHHPDVFPAFVFIFNPPQVSNQEDYLCWYKRLLQCSSQSHIGCQRIRFLAYGVNGQGFEVLASETQKSNEVMVLKCTYGTRNIPKELIAQDTENGPNALFRRWFVLLSEALRYNDAKSFLEMQKQAIKVTNAQNWHEQSVVVYLISGAAFLKWEDYEMSLQAYHKAEGCALKAVEQSHLHLVGNKLAANAVFGEASVYLVQKQFEKAATCYERSVAYTEAAQEPLLTVEAWRMVNYCHSQADEDKKALEAGFFALNSGMLLEEGMRLNSTLPLISVRLYKQLSEKNNEDKDYHKLQELFVALYGENWKEILESQHLEDIA